MMRRLIFFNIVVLMLGLIGSVSGCNRRRLVTIVHGGNGPPTLVLLQLIVAFPRGARDFPTWWQTRQQA